MEDRDDEIAEVVPRWLDETLEHDFYEAGPEDGRLVLHVAHDDVAAVQALADAHPPVLPDGTRVPVTVFGRAGDSWLSAPEGGPAHEPVWVPHEDLLGLDVHEAARLATAAGWLVRAYEPEAILTADMRWNRLDLGYDADGKVVRVSRS